MISQQSKCIPTVKVQPLGHRCQASGVKRPSSQDPHDARNEDQGSVKETKGKDNTVKGGSVRETKRQKVLTGAVVDDTEIPVS